MDAKFAELKDVEIFSAGTYKIDEDTTVTYTDEDVQSIVDNTNKLIADGKHNPPGKLGHDGAQAFAAASGLPAIGWAENLRRVGSKLIADFKQVPELAYKALEKGLYKKISSEIYHEKASKKEFDVEGKVLRAVAFLGADVPKVKGLAAFLAEVGKAQAAVEQDNFSVVTYQRHAEGKGGKMAKKLMVPANRHPYGALVEKAAESDHEDLADKKMYKVHGVHPDGTYDVHEHKNPENEVKGVSHDDLALMSETNTEEKMSKDEIALAEKKTKDAIELAEKNASEAAAAKAENAQLKKQSRDAAIAEFCEKNKTILTPALQPKFVALAEAAVDASVKFAEGEEKPFLNGLITFLSELISAKQVALGEITPTPKEGADMNEAEVKLAEEPFKVHLEDASRSEVKPILVHADLTVAAEEYAEKHPGMKFSEALKHVAKLDKAAISQEGGR